MAEVLLFTLDPLKVVEGLQSHPQRGLSEAEAARRLARYGPNILKKEKQKSIFQIFIGQFISPIVWLLIAAGAAAFWFGEIPEAIAIIIVILINTLIGFIMEVQAVRSMRELRKMGRARAPVIRDGVNKLIDSANLVPGDLISLQANDLVTADARVIEEHNLEAKEAALTGESAPSTKSKEKLPRETPLGDLSNYVFKGTLITRGSGKAIVTGTGSATELGKISKMAHEAKKENPPLDKRLNALGRNLIWLTLIIIGIILIPGIIEGGDLFLMIETAIALAVAAIPEGLPVIASITLARGMVKLARNNAIVKSLEAVQTLGETNVIFTDKTGTLTENELYLDLAAFDSGTRPIAETDRQNPEEAKDHQAEMARLLKTGLLCNDSVYDPQDGKPGSGDPIELALMRAAYELLPDAGSVRDALPRIGEMPFDEDLKLMATLHQDEDAYLACVKGAPETILERSESVMDAQGNQRSLTDRDKWLAKMNEMSASGLRLLGFAFKTTAQKPTEDDFAHGLTFIGVGGFIDPARSDVKEAILACQRAGIKVIMVTGDHAETAANIAEAVGLVERASEAVKMHSSDIPDQIREEAEPQDRIFDTEIFARTIPSQKLELVKLYQRKKFIVGMTGDGVNDAPALKKADIGIAMGQRGTEVAKEVADIILKDDSFSSIVLAIRQGRIIFKNIRNFVIYLLSCNLSEIMVVGTASLMGIPLPLLPLQILFLNMVTDVFPALALGMNAGEKDIMKEKPRDTREPIISGKLWLSIVSYGIAMTTAVIGIEMVAVHVLELNDVQVNNMAFYTLILVQLWNVFNLPRARTSFFINEITKNRYVWIAILISMALVVLAWMIPPVREALSMGTLQPQQWGLILGFSFIPMVLIQLFKRLLKVII